MSWEHTFWSTANSEPLSGQNGPTPCGLEEAYCLVRLVEDGVRSEDFAGRLEPELRGSEDCRKRASWTPFLLRPLPGRENRRDKIPSRGSRVAD